MPDLRRRAPAPGAVPRAAGLAPAVPVPAEPRLLGLLVRMCSLARVHVHDAHEDADLRRPAVHGQGSAVSDQPQQLRTDYEMLVHYRLIISPEVYFAAFDEYEEKHGEGSVVRDTLDAIAQCQPPAYAGGNQ